MSEIADVKEEMLPIIEVPPELRGLSDEEIIKRSEKELREVSGNAKKGNVAPASENESPPRRENPTKRLQPFLEVRSKRSLRKKAKFSATHLPKKAPAVQRSNRNSDTPAQRTFL